MRLSSLKWTVVFVLASCGGAARPDAGTAAPLDLGQTADGPVTRADAEIVDGGACTPIAYMPLGADSTWDTWSDARGDTQRFERISLPGITDRGSMGSIFAEETGGIALNDVDDDGLVDVLVMEQGTPLPGAARYFRNEGCWVFSKQSLGLPASRAAFNSHPLFLDFNGDGTDDLLVTRRENGTSAYLGTPGSLGFTDVTAGVGIDTSGVYSSQPHVADLNLDGFLDLVIVADTIGATGSRPRHFVYLFDPATMRFVDFGTRDDVLPAFSPTANEACDPETLRSGPAILVRDLDDDGDIDLVHPYHRDIIDGDAASLFSACSPATFAHGVAVWENHAADQGRFVFTLHTPAAGGAFDDPDVELAERTRIAANALPLRYAGHATSLPYVGAADVDNDGDLDVAVTGPTDPQWHGHSDRMSGKFWRNGGGWQFRAETTEAGLGAMNWTYREWRSLWDDPTMPATSPFIDDLCDCSYDRASCQGFPLEDHQFYGADLVYGDFDNDGWIDFVLVDRHEMEGGERHLRNVLFHNDGDGTFTPEPTTLSGLDSNSIEGEAADLNGDGLLDLVFGTSPGNSSGRANECLSRSMSALDVSDVQFVDRVYWNTGRVGGAAAHHWLRVRLRGLPERNLVGARVFVQAPGTTACSGAGEARTCIGRRDYFPVSSYKSTHGLEAHFGLGSRTAVDVRVELPPNRPGARSTVVFSSVPIDRIVELDVSTGSTTAR